MLKRLALLALALLVGGCGGTTLSTTSGSRSVGAVEGTGHPSPTPSCRTTTLVLQLGPDVSPATGQHPLAMRLVNRGVSSCLLEGYPSVLLGDRAGALPVVIHHGGDLMITAHRPRLLVLRPGGEAFVLVNQYRCDLGDRRRATIVRVGLTGSRDQTMLSLRLTDVELMPHYCGAGDPGSTLTVSPFEPTLQATLGH